MSVYNGHNGRKGVKHDLEPAERERVEGVRPEALEGTLPEAVPGPPEGRKHRGGLGQRCEEYLAGLPAGEKPTPKERVQGEPGPRVSVGTGEGGMAPETERGATRPGEPEKGGE